MIVPLKGRNIPRNKVGDPQFTSLSVDDEDLVSRENFAGKMDALLEVFTPEEIVELVNRSLYQLEYQARSHQKRNAERAALEAPVKLVFKRLFPKQSYAKATDDELNRCIAELKKNV